MRNTPDKHTETGYIDGDFNKAARMLKELFASSSIEFRVSYPKDRALFLMPDGLVEVFNDEDGRNTIVVQHTDANVASALCRQLCYHICEFRPDDQGLAQLSRLLPKAQ